MLCPSGVLHGANGKAGDSCAHKLRLFAATPQRLTPLHEAPSSMCVQEWLPAGPLLPGRQRSSPTAPLSRNSAFAQVSYSHPLLTVSAALDTLPSPLVVCGWTCFPLPSVPWFSAANLITVARAFLGSLAALLYLPCWAMACPTRPPHHCLQLPSGPASACHSTLREPLCHRIARLPRTCLRSSPALAVEGLAGGPTLLGPPGCAHRTEAAAAGARHQLSRTHRSAPQPTTRQA